MTGNGGNFYNASQRMVGGPFLFVFASKNFWCGVYLQAYIVLVQNVLPSFMCYSLNPWHIIAGVW